MRILLLATSFNALTQRIYVELAERGQNISVELDELLNLLEQVGRHVPLYQRTVVNSDGCVLTAWLDCVRRVDSDLEARAWRVFPRGEIQMVLSMPVVRLP